VINIAHNIKEKKKFIAADFSILLANTCLYFGAGIYCLTNMNVPEFKGLYSALMGVFNLGVTYFLFRKQKVDTNILYLLIGITLTFILGQRSGVAVLVVRQVEDRHHAIRGHAGVAVNAAKFSNGLDAVIYQLQYCCYHYCQ
jgi:hypothetical protein